MHSYITCKLPCFNCLSEIICTSGKDFISNQDYLVQVQIHFICLHLLFAFLNYNVLSSNKTFTNLIMIGLNVNYRVRIVSILPQNEFHEHFQIK